MIPTKCISPFAMLYAARVGCATFARCLLHFVRGVIDPATGMAEPARIGIYADDTRPGNPVRPGPARSFLLNILDISGTT